MSCFFRILLFAFYIACISCNASRYVNLKKDTAIDVDSNYFSMNSIEDIPDVDETLLRFRTSFLDNHFDSAGTITIPVNKFDLCYDTLSHIRVIVSGKVKFQEKCNLTKGVAQIDSVGINYIIIMQTEKSAKKYPFDFKGESYHSHISESGIPLDILEKIRYDFLVRMKYSKYVINYYDGKDFNTSYIYPLYPYYIKEYQEQIDSSTPLLEIIRNMQ